MRKLFLAASGLLFTLSLLTHCQNGIDRSGRKVRDLSELSALMREMQEHCKKMSIAISEGQQPHDLREKFSAILTAKPTQEDMKGVAFEAMAQQFLNHLNSIYTEEISKTEAYNALIASCVACHQQHCQGPIKTIEKLYLR